MRNFETSPVHGYTVECRLYICDSKTSRGRIQSAMHISSTAGRQFGPHNRISALRATQNEPLHPPRLATQRQLPAPSYDHFDPHLRIAHFTPRLGVYAARGAKSRIFHSTTPARRKAHFLALRSTAYEADQIGLGPSIAHVRRESFGRGTLCCLRWSMTCSSTYNLRGGTPHSCPRGV